MFPVRLSFVTYNLWNTQRWPERAPALKHFLDLYQPDILCLQELRSPTRIFLDETLPLHNRVHDAYAGWCDESNIYWNSHYFSEVAHGFEDVQIIEELRGLFWVRLQLVGEKRTILVSTAHFTNPAHEKEQATGLSPRVVQAQHVAAALQKLMRNNEPAFFMGDVNDPLHPSLILYQAGFVSCFAALGQLCPPTFPCYPTTKFQAGTVITNQPIDWIFANQRARSVAAAVPHCYYDDIAPSDHWPVHALYEI